MDIFVEQIVKKESTGKTMALKIAIITGVVAICVVAICFAVIIPLTLLLAAGAVYLGYFLVTGLNIEYEYIVTNGEIDIDKIIAKRKRKRLITVKADSFEKFGLYEDAELIENGVVIVRADGISYDNAPKYYADFAHQNYGQVRLVFSPEEKVIDTIKPYLKRQVRITFDK